MILYPAIDILAGKAVRLTKGDFEAKKIYDEDPLQAAEAWVADGADHLHVVDLDGAREGQPRNLHHLSRIAEGCCVPIQYGGGLRSLPAVQDALQAGASRVILGTAAFTKQGFLADALQRWPGKVLVSVDARGGRLTTAGWTQTSAASVAEVIGEMIDEGAIDLVYTDVDRDGMLQGPDLGALRALAEQASGTRLIYSGGIGALRDLHALAALPAGTLAGVIVGKALYERRFTVAEALEALAEEGTPSAKG
jgi:phosphoribosylformimino-5-aminoimidazole carboxamide ribotide isomerase